MKKSYIIAVTTAIGFLSGCSKKEDTPPAAAPTTELTATVNSAQQVPTNPSTATGTFSGTYTTSSGQLTYTVTYQGMTPSIAHIHSGAPGTSGKVEIPFANLTSPITGTVVLTPEQADNLLNGRMYVNMHSSTYGGGEIRGDIKKK